MQISIKTAKGKSINLEVEDTSETIDIKIRGELTSQVVLGLVPGPDPDQDEGALMRIFVSAKGGKTFTLEMEGSEKIGQVMTKIHEQGGPPVKKQKLIFHGRQLRSNLTLADYDIKTDSNLVIYESGCVC